jgi:hypothetical protein
MKEQILYKFQTIKAIQNSKEYILIIIDRINISNIPLKIPLFKGMLHLLTFE